MSAKDHSEFEVNMLATIEEHGWFCMSVFDPDGKQPEFSYSIGFSKTLDAPEFIVFGLNRELRHSMLWEVFRQIKAGAEPDEGKAWSDLLVEKLYARTCLRNMLHLLIGFGRIKVMRVTLKCSNWFGRGL